LKQNRIFYPIIIKLSLTESELLVYTGCSQTTTGVNFNVNSGQNVKF